MSDRHVTSRVWRTRRNRRSSSLLLAAGVAGALTSVAQAQVTTWTGPASGSWSTPANWNNGVPNGGAFTALVDAGNAPATSALVNGNFSVGTLGISAGDQVTIGNGFTFTVGSLVGNAGTILIDATGNNTALQGSFLLNGAGGVVRLSGANALLGTNGGSITNANNTIRGEGAIGGNNTDWINQGTVNADVAGSSIFIDPRSSATGFTNSGLLTASNGATLRINGQFGGGVSNTGGTISAQDNSLVSLESNLGVTGGTFTTSGTGVIRTAAGNIIFVSGVANTGNWTLENSSTTNVTTSLFNSGSINLAAAANNVLLNFNSGDVNLTGGGAINLSTTGGGVAMIGNGDGRLVNVDNTIRGRGNLGNNNQTVTNGAAGVVSADIAGAVLFVDPRSVTDGFVNQGLMRATGGGILQMTGLFGGGINNTGGTITAAAGSEVQWLGNNGVSGGTVSTTGTGVVRVLAGQAAFVQDLTLAGNVVIDGSGANLNLNPGTITNTGSINVNAGTNNSSTLNVAGGGTVTLTGGGAVNLTRGSSGGEAFVNGSGTIVNVNNTFRGTGNLASNNIAFLNSGTVSADVNGGALFVDPQSVAGAFVNSGTMQATSGGVLQMSGQFGGGINNAGGRIIANNNSRVELFGSIGVSGGTFATTGNGTIAVTNGQTSFVSDVTNDGAIVVTPGSTLMAGGSFNNAGSITVSATTSNAQVGTNGGSVTFAGAGTIRLTETGAGGRAFLGHDSGTVIVGPSQTVRGSGNIANNNVNVVNSGTINADVAGASIFVDPRAVTDGFLNNGLMTASNGGALQFNGQFGGGVTNNGTIAAQNGSVVQLQAGIGISGGTFTGSGTGAVEVLVNHNASIANTANTGTFNVQNGATLNAGGTLSNGGTLVLNPSGALATMNSAGGTLTITGPGTILMNPGAGAGAAVLGQNGGTIDLNQSVRGRGNIASNNVAIINRGSIVATGGGEIFVDPVNVADGFVNPGVMRVETGSQLRFNGQFGGGVNNAGGHIDVDPGGTLRTENTHGLSGGTVTLDGTWNADTSSSSTVTNFRGAGSLNLANNARVNVAAGGGTAGTSRLGALAITTGAKLDLTDHDLVIDHSGASPIQSVRQLLASGFNGGNWSGTGIITSSGTPNGLGIGYADASEIFTTFPATFSGQSVDNTAVLLRFTRFGDADLTGGVNLNDFNRLAANFGAGGAVWSQGDFNYDGTVNLNDFNLLAANFGLSAAGATVTPQDWARLGAAVPEPTSTALCGAAAWAAMSRRRRRANA
jgi:hypothetical protein